MDERRQDLGQFLAAVRAGFAASKADTATAGCVDATFALLAGSVGRAGTAGDRLPACDHLSDALRTARAASPELGAVADAIEALRPNLAWHRRSGGPSASDNFDDGHANAMIVGPGGIEDRADAWVGLSLLAPDVRYPDHQHAPEEVYLVLAPGAFRRDDGVWFEPGPGGSFYNSPGIVHAMRSGPAPLLAVWCLRPEPGP